METLSWNRLPHYDENELTRIMEHLTQPDSDLATPTEVRRGEEDIALNRAPDTQQLFEILKTMPSYIVPSRRKVSEAARVMKLGRLLANDALLADGPEQAAETILAVMRAAYEQHKTGERFQKIVSERGKIEILAAHWRVGEDMDDERETVTVEIAPENINGLFEAAGKKFGEGLHKAFWCWRVEQDATAKTGGKLELFALSLESGLLKNIETAAQAKTQEWLAA